jgi:hypothetical protein
MIGVAFLGLAIVLDSTLLEAIVLFHWAFVS